MGKQVVWRVLDSSDQDRCNCFFILFEQDFCVVYVQPIAFFFPLTKTVVADFFSACHHLLGGGDLS